MLYVAIKRKLLRMNEQYILASTQYTGSTFILFKLQLALNKNIPSLSMILLG